MKRTKEWWTRLTKQERHTLVAIERGGWGSSYSASGMLPDDCSDCDACGQPMLGTGLCPKCTKELNRLINKANSREVLRCQR